MSDRPRCYNRPDFKDTVLVQDGWEVVGYSREGGEVAVLRLARMVERPNRMSRGCQQHGPFGEATRWGWDCDGCRHKPAPDNQEAQCES